MICLNVIKIIEFLKVKTMKEKINEEVKNNDSLHDWIFDFVMSLKPEQRMVLKFFLDSNVAKEELKEVLTYESN